MKYLVCAVDPPRHTGFDARPQIPPGFLASKCFIDMVTTARPLVVGGHFDRSAIMAKALSIMLAAATRRRR